MMVHCKYVYGSQVTISKIISEDQISLYNFYSAVLDKMPCSLPKRIHLTSSLKQGIAKQTDRQSLEDGKSKSFYKKRVHIFI